MSTMSVEYSQLHQPPQQSEVQCMAFSQYLKALSQLSALSALAAWPMSLLSILEMRDTVVKLLE